MKFILTLLFASSISLGMAQTPLISHKSHSGTSISYFIDPSSNFGAVKMDYHMETWEQNSAPKPSEVFIPLNDSVILKRTTSGRIIGTPEIKTDTLANKNRYSVFEFRRKYEDSVRQNNLKKWSYQYASQSPDQQSVPVKKKKKSYLLFLFGITGGGMLLMRLFNRSKITKPSIA